MVIVIYLIASYLAISFWVVVYGGGDFTPSLRKVVWALLIGWAAIPITILWLIWCGFILFVRWLFHLN